MSFGTSNVDINRYPPLVRVLYLAMACCLFANTHAIAGPTISSDTSGQTGEALQKFSPRHLDAPAPGVNFLENGNGLTYDIWDRLSVQDMLADDNSESTIRRQPSLPGTDILRGSQGVKADLSQVSIRGKLAISHRMLLRQSEDLRVLGELLVPADDMVADNNYGNGLGYQNAGGSNGTQFNNQLTLQDFAVDMLAPRANDLKIIRSSLKDLRNYVMVTQPKTSDLIIRDTGTGQPIIYEADSKRIVEADVREREAAQQFSRPERVFPRPVFNDTSNINPVIKYFSLTSLWEFLTAPITLMFYMLCLVCWAAWHYIIRKYV